MYSASRITPVQRMRRQSSSNSTTATTSSGRPTSPSKQQRRSSLTSVTSTGSATTSYSLRMNNNGDYQVLIENVNRDRQLVQTARIALATSLDQLGEHHVRQKEYDDAMDAFTEALREKRSVFYNHFNVNNNNNNSNNTGHSRGSSVNLSFLSGTTASSTNNSVIEGRDELDVEEDEDEDESTTFSNKDPAGQDVMENFHDKAIDELVVTLRSMGNVHSLRGEQDEAMRYFTEVTSLRAQKMCNIVGSGDSVSVDTKSLLSGMNDENSTLMSEINEDVKALDDLFRSISFRSSNNINAEMSSPTSNSEKRKSRSGTPSNKKQRKGPSSSDRRSTSSSTSQGPTATPIVENEPFDRSTAPSPTSSPMSTFPSSSTSGGSSSPSGGNEAADAMEMYKNAIELYSGPVHRIEQHKEMYNSLALRVDLLNESRKNNVGLGGGSGSAMDQSSSTPTSTAAAVAEALYSSPESATQAMSTKAADLDLALEIYQFVLAAHQESATSALNQSFLNSAPSTTSHESTFIIIG